MNKNIKFRLIKVLGICFGFLFSFSHFNFLFSPSYAENNNYVKTSNQTLAESEIWQLSSYDSRDYGLVTSVKDQGSSSLCWAYSAISACETSILKSGIDENASKDTLSLSPTSIGYGRYNRPADPLNNVVGEASGNNWLNYSGESYYAGILMSQWWGPISNSLPASTNAYENNLYKLKNMVKIYDDNTFYNFDTRILEMKKAIAKYGAITFSYNNLRETTYYNPKRETGDNSSLHACTIIGWNDNISASNFVPSGTEKDGGWLIKNSYSSLPYFWLSYECVSSNIYAFDFSKQDDYDYNYFYDDSLNGGFTEDLKTQYVANIYEAKKSTTNKDEYLKAVNVAFACKNTTVTIDIYTNLADSSDPESGELKATKQQTFEHSGHRIIELDNLIKVSNGEKFSIVVRLSSTSSSSPYVATAQGNGLCYRKINGRWSKINNNALRIKGYTVLSEKQIEEPLVIDIKNASFSQVPNCFYTGEEIKPNIEIMYDGKTLVENIDYTISYSNNINYSNFAKITIVGTGNFGGEQEILFTINKAEKPNIAIPTTVDNLQNYKTLSKINLPESFVWSDPNFELNNGINIVSIIYTGLDKDNYENITFSVQVNYTQSIETGTPEEKPSDNDNIGEGTNYDDKTRESLSTLELVIIITGGGCLGGVASVGIWLYIKKIKKRTKSWLF